MIRFQPKDFQGSLPTPYGIPPGQDGLAMPSSPRVHECQWSGMSNSNYTDTNARLQYVVEATIFWDIAINIARIVLVTMSEAVKEHPTESTTMSTYSVTNPSAEKNRGKKKTKVGQS